MHYIYLLFFISSALASPTKEASETYILKQFPKDIKIKMHTLPINKKIKSTVQNQAKQKFYRNKLYYWNISTKDSTIAYAFLDNVKGKSMPITFMVILDRRGNVIHSTIIKYREGYGGEVGNERWLAQFNHYSPDSSYKVGKDIDAISGATISVNSVTKGIQKIVLLYPYIKDKLQ